MQIIKSEGFTESEKLLSTLCEKTFLKLWSYPNPIKEDGDELCDLLAVFENYVFIFFDRTSDVLNNSEKDISIKWNRWKKKVIDNQTRTAHGAEKYIKSGNKIYLDKDKKIEYPIKINSNDIVLHKIIIAHGAKDECERFSKNNIYGSLAIEYSIKEHEIDLKYPFLIHINRNNPVHILDSYNFPILFNELDTFFDLSTYLDAKIEALNKYNLVYCGEEDLLAHYYMNYDENLNRHYIGTKEKNINYVMIGEGEWKDFIKLEEYKNKKQADKVSYLWDEIIQITCQNTLDGTILGDTTPLRGTSAIQEMAKEPRFHRRALSEQISKSITSFPTTSEPLMRNISFMPSFYKDKAYVFLQIKCDYINNYENDYRPIRQKMLEIACGAAKNRYKDLETIIGIAIDAPKYAKNGNSEDFILMDCSNWTEETEQYYKDANKELRFFQTDKLIQNKKDIKEFPDNVTIKKPGRNELCPCGSGKKYKYCCINRFNKK